MVTSSSISTQRGITMIEVLVTIVILVIGLLGLAALQSRLQVSEMESYQRAQALILLDDMANRIMTNRALGALTCYTSSNPLGTNAAGTDFVTPTACANALATQDMTDWSKLLFGAAETAAGKNVGAMIGARGCIEGLPDNEYLVTVAWQGLAEISAPPDTVACGKDMYNGGICTNDRCRRVITTIVRIGKLPT